MIPIQRMILTLLLCMPLMLFSACGLANDTATNIAVGNGSVSPENAVDGFFSMLNQALKDPAIRTNEDARDRWVEQLTAFFAPNERDDQRIMISAALNQFVTDITRELEEKPDQTITLEVNYDRNELSATQVSDTRALVHIDGSIRLRIVSDTTWEQPVPLSQLIGRSDSSIPVVRIGNYWFLTEG